MLSHLPSHWLGRLLSHLCNHYHCLVASLLDILRRSLQRNHLVSQPHIRQGNRSSIHHHNLQFRRLGSQRISHLGILLPSLWSIHRINQQFNHLSNHRHNLMRILPHALLVSLQLYPHRSQPLRQPDVRVDNPLDYQLASRAVNLLRYLRPLLGCILQVNLLIRLR